MITKQTDRQTDKKEFIYTINNTITDNIDRFQVLEQAMLTLPINGR